MSLLILTQTHADFREDIPYNDALVALPDTLGSMSRLRTTSVHENQRTEDLNATGWERLRARQEELVRRQARSILNDPELEIAYFGATYIPLAVHLGQLMPSFARIHIFQHHHNERHWAWTGTGVRPDFKVYVHGLPTAPLEAPRIRFRIATSYRIQDEQVRGLPEPDVDISIDLGPLNDLDALKSPEELATVVGEFTRSIQVLANCCTGMQVVDLLIAGPVGLAFAIGNALPPTSLPPIHIWKFVQDGQPYRRAMVLQQTKGGGAWLEPSMKILFIATGPRGASHLQYDEEHRQIRDRLERSQVKAELDMRLAARVKDLQSHLDGAEVPILHISGHGHRDGSLVFEGEGRTPRTVRVDAFVNLIKLAGSDRLRLVVLNTCHSAPLAKELTEAGVVDFAVGMSDAIHDDAAIHFGEALYRALANGRSVSDSVELGRNQIQLDDKLHHYAKLPQLFWAVGASPDTPLIAS